MAAKAYVSIKAIFDVDGTVHPYALLWDDEWFDIDRVTDRRQAASLKCGGQGMRYTCEMSGQKRYLFFEEPRWFLEVEDYKCVDAII